MTILAPFSKEAATEFVNDSPFGEHLSEGLQSCSSSWIRAAIIYRGCTKADAEWLRTVADELEKGN